MIQMRILLPVVLGLVAAVGNFTVLSQATATTELVALREDVKPGVPLRQEHFKPVGVRGDSALFAGAVAWDKRQALEGLTLRRKVRAGELLLHADVEQAANQISLPPEGHRTQTIPARLSAVALKPYPGENVMLSFRQSSSGAPAMHGPFRYLGWVATPTAPGREADTIQVAVAVGVSDPRGAELQKIAESGNADRLLQVEVVRVAQPAK